MRNTTKKDTEQVEKNLNQNTQGHQTYVKVYSDFGRFRILYAGPDKLKAEAITILDVEEIEYVNFGGAYHYMEVWENGVLIDHVIHDVSLPDDCNSDKIDF